MEQKLSNETIRDTVSVETWPSEKPLYVIIILYSIFIWIILAVSIVGIVYALFIALFLFLTHMMFIAHVRGNSVKLGNEQFPDLYNRIVEISGRVGLKKVPDAYIMEAGGSLNALATKFLRSRMVILYSDMIEACSEKKGALDMIIGHELGHIKEGHLNAYWFIAPGLFLPIIGSAYSRAREYTCDRYGAAISGNRQEALIGLSILAAGGKHGPEVNLSVFAEQRYDFNTGLMTLGKWFMSHPPLCDRIYALEPGLIKDQQDLSKGTLRALLILIIFPIIIMIISMVVALKFSGLFDKLSEIKHESELKEELLLDDLNY